MNESIRAKLWSLSAEDRTKCYELIAKQESANILIATLENQRTEFYDRIGSIDVALRDHYSNVASIALQLQPYLLDKPTEVSE